MNTSGKTILVHKLNEEGSLQIDALTGRILSEHEDRPEWSEGLAVAQLAERHGFYNSRLGPSYTEAMQTPDIMAFEDLSWLGVNAEGDEMELSASDEFRMEAIGTVLGTEREATYTGGELTTSTAGSHYEAELSLDTKRTPEEMEAFEKAQQEKGFEEAGKQSATG